MRVTQGVRRCDFCGTEITTEEIDRQEAERAKANVLGCLGCGGVLLVLIIVGAVFVSKNPQLAEVPADNASTPQPASTLNTGSIAVSSDAASSTSQESVPPVADQDLAADGGQWLRLERPYSRDTEEGNAGSTSGSEVNAEDGHYVADADGESSSLIQKAIELQDEDSSEVRERLSTLNSRSQHSSEGQSETKKLNSQGLDALRKKDYSTAAMYFGKAAQLNTTNAKYLSNLSMAQMYSGELDKAKQNLFKSIALAPEREVAWNDLGLVYAKNHEQRYAAACLVIAHRISNGKSMGFLQSLDKDEDVAVRLAASEARRKLLCSP